MIISSNKRLQMKQFLCLNYVTKSIFVSSPMDGTFSLMIMMFLSQPILKNTYMIVPQVDGCFSMIFWVFSYLILADNL